jgi:hypothetical protein
MYRHGLRISALVGALVLAALSCGCQGRPTKVEGIVTLDGKPVEGATVTFLPKDGSGRSASGLTGSDGVFHLTTFNTGDGALPGTYKVTVTIHESVTGSGPPNTSSPDSMKKIMMEGFKKSDTEARGKSKKPSPIPAVYREVRSTPLQYQVPVDGRLALELKSTGGS